MLSAAMLAFAGMATVSANPVHNNTYVTVSAQDERTPVKIEELPDDVKAALSGEDYAGWAPTEAFLVSPANGDKYFEVSLSKDGESKVVNFDEAGKVVTAPTEEAPAVAPETPAQEPAAETPAQDPNQMQTPEAAPETPGS